MLLRYYDQHCLPESRHLNSTSHQEAMNSMNIVDKTEAACMLFRLPLPSTSVGLFVSGIIHSLLILMEEASNIVPGKKAIYFEQLRITVDVKIISYFS